MGACEHAAVISMMIDNTVEVATKYIIHRPLAVSSKDVWFSLREIPESSSNDVREPCSPLETAVSSKKSLDFDCTDDTVVPMRPRHEKREVQVIPITSA